MPVALERKLKREARKKHLSKKRTGAYVYGTLNKLKKEQQGKSARKKSASKRKKK